MTAPYRFTVSIVGEGVMIPVDVMASVNLSDDVFTATRPIEPGTVERVRDHTLERHCPPPWAQDFPKDKMTLHTAITFAEVLKLLELLGIPSTGMPPEEVER